MFYTLIYTGGARGKEPACKCRRCKRCGFSPWVGKILWRRAWPPTPVFLPGDVRDVVSVPGWGRSSEGGHGHPLQFSCLENPMDIRAWQASTTEAT